MRRWRRSAVGAGLIVSAIILMMWVASLYREFMVLQHFEFRPTGAYDQIPVVILILDNGMLYAGWFRYSYLPTIWSVGQGESHVASPEWWPVVKIGSGGATHGIQLALWFPFLLVAALTVFLWWRGRRTPPGYCRRCGYNLTGNVSGICPECGDGRDSKNQESAHRLTQMT